MHRSLQFGMREKPASDRRHGSRSSISAPSLAEQKEFQNGNDKPSNPTAPGSEKLELQFGNISKGATGAIKQNSCTLLTVEDVARLLHVPASWVYGRMRKRSVTRLPAYRLGKYWRF